MQGALGSISGQGTRSHMLQPRVHRPQPKGAHMLQLRPSAVNYINKILGVRGGGEGKEKKEEIILLLPYTLAV